MTISSTTNRVSYTGNGVTTAFAFGYKFLADSDLKVYQAGTLKTLTTHYTVTGAGSDSGGTVTFLAAPANLEEVVILRDPAITQGLDLVENDPLPAESLESALDRTIMICQRLQDQIDRSISIGDSVTSAIDVVLPSPDARKALIWNATEDGIINSTYDPDEQATLAAAQAAAAATSASNASTSATNASTSATNASTSATNASTSATNASNSEAAAVAVTGASAIKFLFDASTTMADPGTGDIRLNNATVGSVTAIAVSANSADTSNPDVSNYIATWADSTNTVKGHVILRKSGSPQTFAIYTISAVTDNTTWLQLTVSHVASNGSWSASDGTYVGFIRAGNDGDFQADGTIPMTGNLTFSGTGLRITGDFSNATVANRLLFQTSTANGATALGAVPNGTATGAYSIQYNSSDLANHSFGYTAMLATDYRIDSNKLGTGTYLPMTFYTSGSERMRIDTSGNVGIGVTDFSASGANAKFAMAGGVLNLDSGQAIAWGGGTARPGVIGDKATGALKLIAQSAEGVVAISPYPLGYGTGAGGTVTQATSRTTGVTLNKPTGAITLFTAAGSTTAATFTVTNSIVAATDTVILSVKSSTNVYLTAVTAVAAGSFNITFWTTGGTSSDAPVINFAVIKGVTS